MLPPPTISPTKQSGLLTCSGHLDTGGRGTRTCSGVGEESPYFALTLNSASAWPTMETRKESFKDNDDCRAQTPLNFGLTLSACKSAS